MSDQTVENLENSNRSYKSANTRLSNENSRLRRQLEAARADHIDPDPDVEVNVNNSPEVTEEESEENMENNRTTSWSWLPWALLALLIIGLLIWQPWNKAPVQLPPIKETVVVEKYITATAPAEAPTMTPTPQPQSQPVGQQPNTAIVAGPVTKVDVPTSLVAASNPAPVCPGWNPDKKVTQMLPPGMTAIGDVVVNDTPQYDNGSGESTIVVNLSSKDVKIFAEWGSGCEWTTDVQSVVDKQRYAGCGDANNDGIVDMCNNVRIVLVTDMGTQITFKEPTVK